MALMTTKCNSSGAQKMPFIFLLQAQFYTEVLVITSIYHPNYRSLIKMQIPNLDGACQDSCSYYLNLHSHMYTCSKPGVFGSSFSGFPLFQTSRYSEIRCSIIDTVVSLLFKDVVSDPQVHLQTYSLCTQQFNKEQKYLNFYTCKPVSFTGSSQLLHYLLENVLYFTV